MSTSWEVAGLHQRRGDELRGTKNQGSSERSAGVPLPSEGQCGWFWARVWILAELTSAGSQKVKGSLTCTGTRSGRSTFSSCLRLPQKDELDDVPIELSKVHSVKVSAASFLGSTPTLAPEGHTEFSSEGCSQEAA